LKRVVIRNTAIYHPQDKISNEQIIEEFRGYGKEIGRLLKVIGRKERFIDKSGKETPLSMGIEASLRLLKEAGIRGSDLDMIIFSSGTPEYLVPTNSAFLHNAMEGKNESIVYDMNANCVGMVVAIEQASSYLSSHPKMKYALIVGSEQMNKYGEKEDIVTKAVFGDVACAILLESVEDQDIGIIDSAYYTDSDYVEDMKFPKNGLSHAYKGDISNDENRIFTAKGYDAFVLVPSAVKNISIMLERNQIKKEQISRYFFSQVNYRGFSIFSELLNEDVEKFEYIGDRYAYSGTSSPFVALHTAIKEGRLKRGDIFVIWSVGAGMVSCSLLCKF
jgi:3-oxoacyl-[acyl-carrier-protein] synthase-3